MFAIIESQSDMEPKINMQSESHAYTISIKISKLNLQVACNWN